MPKVKTTSTKLQREKQRCLMVWASVEYYKVLNKINIDTMARIMQIAPSTAYSRKLHPEDIRVGELVRLAEYLKIDLLELISK